MKTKKNLGLSSLDNALIIHCDIICEYCEGCVDLVPKKNYSCFKGQLVYRNFDKYEIRKTKGDK
jgi:hypothetical protein